LWTVTWRGGTQASAQTAVSRTSQLPPPVSQNTSGSISWNNISYSRSSVATLTNYSNPSPRSSAQGGGGTWTHELDRAVWYDSNFGNAGLEPEVVTRRVLGAVPEHYPMKLGDSQVCVACRPVPPTLVPIEARLTPEPRNEGSRP
jgi:hypothetical protein